MLRMVPLEEMIDRKEADEPIWIAEYMIYCDAWELEINPEDFNDYSISGSDFDRGKITLTNSLGEFIARFLAGGVYGKLGLCHWRDEIIAKTYGNSDPNEMKPLLSAFRDRLNLGLISTQEVIDWADWLISVEDGPDPFFLKIFHSKDSDELLAILNSINLSEDVLQKRVVFGIVRSQLSFNKITADKALSILVKFVHITDFTPFEIKEMRYLIEKYADFDHQSNKTSQIELNDRVKAFFDNYREFDYYPYKNWHKVNDKIVKDFTSKS
jgi:hypothetical protein